MIAAPGKHRRAIVSYATSSDYACAALLMFETVRREFAKAHGDDTPLNVDLVLLMAPFRAADWIAHIRAHAPDVRLLSVPELTAPRVHNPHDPTWRKSPTKLWAFRLTGYRQLMHIDADSYVVRDITTLFTPDSTPDADVPAVIVSHAYWLVAPHKRVCTALFLARPDERVFERAQEIGKYDMDTLQEIFPEENDVKWLSSDTMQLDGDLVGDGSMPTKVYWSAAESAEHRARVARDDWREAFVFHFSQRVDVAKYGKPWLPLDAPIKAHAADVYRTMIADWRERRARSCPAAVLKSSGGSGTDRRRRWRSPPAAEHDNAPTPGPSSSESSSSPSSLLRWLSRKLLRRRELSSVAVRRR